MSIEFDRGSPGKFDSRTLNRKTLHRWTGRTPSLQHKMHVLADPTYIYIYMYICFMYGER